MAEVTVNVNTVDTDNWASTTGAVGDIDEAIASADGNTYAATADSHGTTLILGLGSPGLSDSDTISQVDITVRASATGTAGTLELDVDLLIGGTAQGTAQTFSGLTGTLATSGTLNDTGWNSDWTASQLDGMQVQLTATSSGMPGTVIPAVDCIDVLITYTGTSLTEETVAATSVASASVTEEFLLSSAAQAAPTYPDLSLPPENFVVPRMIPSGFIYPAPEVEDSGLSAGEQVLSSGLTWLAMDNPDNTVTSGNFETVVDKTGNGRNLTQSTSSLRPSELDSSGIISAEYDATDDVLVGASANWDFTMFDDSTGGTYAIVLRADSMGEGNFGHWWCKHGSGTPDSRAWTDNASVGDQDLESLIVGDGGNAQVNTNNNRPITQGQVHMVFLTYDGSSTISNGIEYWVDNANISIGVVSSGGTPVSDTSGNDFLLGNRFAGDRTWDGGFYELAYWNSELSTSDREAVQDFWADKYSITLS
jgi:hypothetical protein